MIYSGVYATSEYGGVSFGSSVVQVIASKFKTVLRSIVSHASMRTIHTDTNLATKRGHPALSTTGTRRIVLKSNHVNTPL